MKNKLVYIFLCTLGIGFSGCMESDDFDGLTDSRPEVAVTFPDRTYDQLVGLGYIANGYTPTTQITYQIELEGGSAEMASIVKVEGRAGDATLGNCPTYATLTDSEIPATGRTFEFTRPLSYFIDNGAICDPSLDKANTYFELIFTIQLDNGDQVVSMPVRGIFKG